MKRKNTERRAEVPNERPRRFTGPELSDLLDQVKRELGAEASIVKAGKVRTGGVAGFFAKEAFEVLVAPGEDATSAAGQPAIAAAEAGTQDEAPTPVAITPRSGPAMPPSTGEVSTTLLQRAEAISIQEQMDNTSRAGAVETYDLRDREAGRDSRFRTVLEAELHRPEVVGEPEPDPGTGVRSELLIDPDLVSGSAESASGRSALSATHPSIEAAWERVLAIDGRFVQPPTDPSVISIVGDLESALSVASRMIESDDGGFSELVVFTTEEAGANIVPQFLAHRYEEVSEHVLTWTVNDRRGIVVIDAALGAELKVAVQRVRNLGSALLRLAYDDPTSAGRILGLLEHIGGHVVVDVVSGADLAHVNDLVTGGVPVASIGGRRLDPSRLFAMAHVRDG